MSLFSMQNVSYFDNLTQIIQKTSLNIEKGTVTALLGEPGSGKSTILKLLAGIIIPSSGKIFYNDKNIFKMKESDKMDFRLHTAFMFQNSALWANQSIYQNLELPLKIHFPQMSDGERDIKIKEMIKLVEYNKSLQIRPASLSIGEQKKIAFARALICKPDTLFLDEPTESLDEVTTDLFISIIKEFCYNKNTLIYVSHDKKFVDTFQNDKYYFSNGSIVDSILFNQNEQEDYDEI